MKRKVWITAAVVAVMGAVVAWRAYEYVYAPLHAEQAWVYLPAGTGADALRDSLARAFDDPALANKVVRIWSAASKEDTPTAHGAYRFERGDHAKDMARRLVRGRQTPVRLTINNVRTLPDLAARIDGQLELSAEEFLAACDSVLPGAGFKSRAEYTAAFLPDTYEFYWTSTPAATVERLLEYRNDFWTDTRRARARELGLNPVKVATLASIAEEETNDAAERGVVARLYLNRLNRGMKLQADPTVKFAVGDFTLRRILGKHLNTPSPYNTYLNTGLPPGPIRVAQRATLQAVLDAKPHSYIYMCAKEDFSGRHNFATDYATHLQNAARYRRALDARGI